MRGEERNERRGEERRAFEDWTNETPPVLSASNLRTHAPIPDSTAAARGRGAGERKIAVTGGGGVERRGGGGGWTGGFPPSALRIMYSRRIAQRRCGSEEQRRQP
jgi:hypothetical protein